MKKYTFIFSFILFSLALSAVSYAAVPVVVKVSPELSRSVEYMNYSKDIRNGYQRFELQIYNIGSIGCITRARFDIYNSSDDSLLHTSWSEAKAVEAGGYDIFDAYWYPYNITGNFYAKMRVHQCYDIFEEGTYDFFIDNRVDNETRKDEIIGEDSLDVRLYSNTKNEMVLELKSEKDMENIIVSPAESNPSRIIPGANIKSLKKGEIKYLKINYSISIWKESNFILNIFDKENNYFSVKEIKLKKPEPIDWKNIIIGILSLIIFIFAFLEIRRNKIKKNKQTLKNILKKK